jgi:hypothetical protein
MDWRIVNQRRRGLLETAAGSASASALKSQG